MANSLFIKADEVAELLGVSRAEAYRIIKRLNDQLSSRGFIVVKGRVNRKYLEEQIYSVTVLHDVYLHVSTSYSSSQAELIAPPPTAHSNMMMSSTGPGQRSKGDTT